jgi:hypothetical protein
MNSLDRLNLKKLIDGTEAEDNTEYIRKMKHSKLIRDDIRKMDTFHNARLPETSNDEFRDMCQRECTFLYNNYTDIFNKMLKREIDLTIMTKLLIVLKLIEDEKMDQHEASVRVGTLLKELYVDSALKRAENLDKEYADAAAEKAAIRKDPIQISWKEYKYVSRNKANGDGISVTVSK